MLSVTRVCGSTLGRRGVVRSSSAHWNLPVCAATLPSDRPSDYAVTTPLIIPPTSPVTHPASAGVLVSRRWLSSSSSPSSSSSSSRGSSSMPSTRQIEQDLQSHSRPEAEYRVAGLMSQGVDVVRESMALADYSTALWLLHNHHQSVATKSATTKRRKAAKASSRSSRSSDGPSHPDSFAGHPLEAALRQRHEARRAAVSRDEKTPKRKAKILRGPNGRYLTLGELLAGLSSKLGAEVQTPGISPDTFVNVAVTLSSINAGMSAKSVAAKKLLVLLALFIVKVPDRLDSCSPRQLALLAWAYARAEVKKEPLFAGIASRFLRHLDADACSVRDVIVIANSFGRSGYRSEEFFDRLADAALEHLPRYNERNLATLSTSFVMCSVQATRLHVAIGDRAAEYLASEPSVSAQATANIAWGLVHQGVFHLGFFTRLAQLFPNLEPNFRGPGLRQLHTVSLALQFLSPFPQFAFPPHFLERCRDFLITNEPRLLAPVVAAVNSVCAARGLPQPVTRFQDPSTYALFQVAFPGHRVALQLWTRSHYTGRSPAAPLNQRADLLRRVAEATGWHMLYVPCHAWEPLKTVDLQREYIATLLGPVEAALRAPPSVSAEDDPVSADASGGRLPM